MKRVCVSGYFNPLHVGHLEYLTRAKGLAGEGGQLVVIVNNDFQSYLKKGSSFMPEEERVEILRALRPVDEVVLSVDSDRTVRQTLRQIEPRVTHFANGGDQFSGNIPEREVCLELGIELVDGLGDKIQSSSWLIEKAARN